MLLLTSPHGNANAQICIIYTTIPPEQQTRCHMLRLCVCPTECDGGEAERKRREREEKKQERLRAQAEKKATPKPGGRAMRLGAKKLAKD